MSTERNLEFIETFTLEEFKSRARCKSVALIPSPKTGKIFMADESGKPLGAVGAKLLSAIEGGTVEEEVVVVSAVVDKNVPTDKRNDQTFFMIHTKGSGGTEPIFTF